MYCINVKDVILLNIGVLKPSNDFA